MFSLATEKRKKAVKRGAYSKTSLFFSPPTTNPRALYMRKIIIN